MKQSDHGRLTLRAIEVFVAVVEEGSVAAAARRLGASPSSVSQQISNLEAALGAKLIDRAARPFALTPAGYVFHRRALTILDEAAKAQSELVELELTNLPQLRLAVIEDFDADVTPDLVIQLGKALPNCNIVAHSGPSHQNIAALESRAVDMIIATEIEGPADWIEQHPLLRDPYVLVTAKGLLDDLDGEDVTSRLMKAPMVRYAGHQLMGQQVEAQLRRVRLAPARRFEFDNNHSIMAAVVEDRGWTITTPLGFLRTPRFHGDIDIRPLPFQSFARTLSLYARREILGGWPMRTVSMVRGLIARHSVRPAIAVAPWVEGQMRVLGEIEETPPPALRLIEKPA
ncbi:MAG: LysR family transcriptional regulator [Pseudomonadota bacterium]